MPGSTWCLEDSRCICCLREASEFSLYSVQKRKWGMFSFVRPHTGHMGVGDDPRECSVLFRGSHPCEKEETNMRVDNFIDPGRGSAQSTFDAVSGDQENLGVAYSTYFSYAHRCWIYFWGFLVTCFSPCHMDAMEAGEWDSLGFGRDDEDDTSELAITLRWASHLSGPCFSSWWALT